MIRLVLIIQLSLLTISIHFAQNNQVRGLVKLQSSGSKPLADVEVASFGANPVFSNSSGMFELSFAHKKAGDAVSLIVQKDGYEIVNERELEEVVIRSDADEIIIIVMSKQGERAKQALSYYNIILSNTNNNYNRELGEIRSRLDALDEDDTERRALFKQIDDLKREKDALIKKAEGLAKQLAGIDLDQASALAREAMALFEKGEISAAIEIMKDETLDQRLREAQEEKTKAENRLSRAENAVQQSIRNYILKARLCRSDGQAEMAEENYLKAVRADSTNFENVLEMAQFLSQLNRKKDAISWFAWSMKIAVNVQDILRAGFALGEEISFDNQFKEADSVFHELRQLIIQNESDFDQSWKKEKLAYADYWIGDNYYAWNRFDDSRKYLSRSLNSYGELIDSTGDEKLELLMADMKMSLGNIYLEEREYRKADSTYKLVNPVYERFAGMEPEQYAYKLATLFYNAGRLYQHQSELDKSIEYYQKSIAIYRELNKTNFHFYDDMIALVKYGMSVTYYHMKEYHKADSLAKEGLNIFRQLMINKAQSYERRVALIQDLSGSIKRRLSELEEGEEAYLESIAIYSRLFKEYPDSYKFDLGRTYGNLSRLYIYANRFEKAEKVARQGLEIDPSLSYIQSYIAIALLNQDKFSEARKIYSQFKDQVYDERTNKSWNDLFLEDLQELEKAGITHQDIVRIKRILEKKK